MSDTSVAGIVSLGVTVTGISIILTGIRFWMRSRQKARLLADDWLILSAVIFLLGASTCSWLLVKHKGQGYSSHKLDPEVVKENFKANNLLELATSLLTVPCLACSKLSALFFYKRIFCSQGASRKFNIVLWCSIAVMILWLIAFEVLLGNQCPGHISALWLGPAAYKEYCTLSVAALYGQSISDLILDVWILALPIPMIAKLHVNVAKKLSIAAVFLLGVAGLAGSIARLAIIQHVRTLGVTAAHKADSEHETTRIGFFLLFEAGITVIAVSLAPLWQFFAHVAPEALLKGMRSVSQLASDAGSRGSGRSRKSSRKQSSSERLGDTESVQSLSKAHSYDEYPMSDLNKPQIAAVSRDNVHKHGMPYERSQNGY